MESTRKSTATLLLVCTILLCQAMSAQEIVPDNPLALFMEGRDRTEAIRVLDNLHLAYGFGNTFMVTTEEGNVVVDTSLAMNAPHHRKLLTKVSDGPVKYIILTHAHADHAGGVGLWKGPETDVIAQYNHEEFRDYQQRLAGFFALRNSAQFNRPIPGGAANAPVGNYEADNVANILFVDEYTFELGGITFELFHTPGETYDHLTVWIPEFKAAFTGDNYYRSFPNIYSLRGTKPRWALDYVESLNKVLTLKPEILLPSHGLPTKGNEEITSKLTQYRDAILYVHDATVAGMNAGKDVYTLMEEIRLPEDLDIGEGYGKIAWSVRGIYEGYAGWFDGNPAHMYELSPDAVLPELVGLAGGAEAVAKRATELVERGDLVKGLHLADTALTYDGTNRAALQSRLNALRALEAASQNTNERGWLLYGIRETEKRLGE